MHVNESPFPISSVPVANVSSVRQRSLLRYPGGKTWLIPHIQEWLKKPFSQTPELLVEPFCGGGIVSLTAIAEDLVKRCRMAEIDQDVAAFWKAVLHHGPELRERIDHFELSYAKVSDLEVEPDRNDVVSTGFRTLVLNRTRRGGILAPGASLIRFGENGKGVASRWYPDTLIARLKAIEKYADRISFDETDGMDILEKYIGGKGVVVFADPPYTAGGKRAGSRLYKHSDIDHDRLFKLLANSGVEFLMTYDESPEIIELIKKYDFHAVTVVMKNTHHARISELVITNRSVF